MGRTLLATIETSREARRRYNRLVVFWGLS
jgi:hypothetical protein